MIGDIKNYPTYPAVSLVNSNIDPKSALNSLIHQLLSEIKQLAEENKSRQFGYCNPIYRVNEKSWEIRGLWPLNLKLQESGSKG